MKIEKNMYVRTKYGIGKVDETRMFMDKYFEFHLDNNKGKIHNVSDNTYWNNLEDIIGEQSYDIIDLIEVGDYVNGCKVEIVDKENERVDIGAEENYLWQYNEHIKSILTKEQFEREAYKI